MRVRLERNFFIRPCATENAWVCDESPEESSDGSYDERVWQLVRRPAVQTFTLFACSNHSLLRACTLTSCLLRSAPARSAEPLHTQPPHFNTLAFMRPRANNVRAGIPLQTSGQPVTFCPCYFCSLPPKSCFFVFARTKVGRKVAHLQLIINKQRSLPHYRSKSMRRKSKGNPEFQRISYSASRVAGVWIFRGSVFPASGRDESKHLLSSADRCCPPPVPPFSIQSLFVSIFTQQRFTMFASNWNLHFPRLFFHDNWFQLFRRDFIIEGSIWF